MAWFGVTAIICAPSCRTSLTLMSSPNPATGTMTSCSSYTSMFSSIFKSYLDHHQAIVIFCIIMSRRVFCLNNNLLLYCTVLLMQSPSFFFFFKIIYRLTLIYRLTVLQISEGLNMSWVTYKRTSLLPILILSCLRQYIQILSLYFFFTCSLGGLFIICLTYPPPPHPVFSLQKNYRILF